MTVIQRWFRYSLPLTVKRSELNLRNNEVSLYVLKEILT